LLKFTWGKIALPIRFERSNTEYFASPLKLKSNLKAEKS